MAMSLNMRHIRSGVTAVTQNNGALTHVYYQTADGSICVTYRDAPPTTQGSWGGGDGAVIIPSGAAGLATDLAVIHWNDASGDQYRLYYLDNEAHVRERSLTTGGNWVDGPLNDKKIKASPEAKIAAVVAYTNNQAYISVFYNDLDEKLCEVRQVNGSWEQRVQMTVTPLFKNVGA